MRVARMEAGVQARARADQSKAGAPPRQCRREGERVIGAGPGRPPCRRLRRQRLERERLQLHRMELRLSARVSEEGSAGVLGAAPAGAAGGGGAQWRPPG